MDINKSAIASYFKKDRRTIAVYLFGSYAKNSARADSDVDIAVLLSKNTDRMTYADIKLKYTFDLMKILKRDRIDILILNSAGPIARHQVYLKGELVFCRNEKQAIRFKDLSSSEYLDFLPFRRKAENNVINRIMSGGNRG